MLYLLEIEEGRKIRIFDTETDSAIFGPEQDIIRIVKQCNMKFKNATIEHNTIVESKWPHKMEYRDSTLDRMYSQILIKQVENDKYKTVQANGNVHYLSREKLESRIRIGKIANCSFKMYNDGKRDRTEYVSTDTCDENTDREFKEAIDNEYKRFLVKSTLLGLDNRFDYLVEGRSVKLTAYTGESKKVILPCLVTSIAGWAFSYTEVEEVQLNMGLKYIGANAFRASSIKKIEIPETVEYIGQYAFVGNPGLMKIYNINNNKINVINNELVTMSKNTISFDNEIEACK